MFLGTDLASEDERVVCPSKNRSFDFAQDDNIGAQDDSIGAQNDMRESAE